MNYTDLAKACGVSKSTVSRALRNDPIISKKTREKIQKAAQTIGYQQSPLVSAWMSHVRKRGPADLFPTIGWLNFEAEKDFWTAPSYFKGLIQGAKQQLGLCKCTLQEFWMHETGMSVSRMIKILRARGISGLLVPHNTVGSIKDELEEFREHFCCVVLDKPIPDFPSVAANTFTNMRMALQQAWKLGYRRIGFCAYKPHETETEHAASSALLSHNSKVTKRQRVPHLEARPDYLVEDFTEWFEKHHPDVVICQNPICKPVLEKKGYRVPEDVGIIHMNVNDSVGNTSGIYQRQPRIGAKAASLLLSQMSQPHFFDDINAQVYVTGRWQEGETTRIIEH